MKKLVVLGDSLTEGYGVSSSLSFTGRLQEKLSQNHKNWQVINSGISGSTSASGPSRIKWILRNKPDVVILALGANDALRGTKINETQKNLEQTIELALKEKVKVILAGMRAPPNYGEDYTKKFAQIYPELAKKYKLKLIPFLLKDVAGKTELNLPDGIHPNEKGHEVIAENVYKEIKDIL